jgi:YVTN family beta-propeller protein
MKKIIFPLFMLILSMLAANRLTAQDTHPYQFEKKITLPGDAGYDYVFIDQAARRLYVSHGVSVQVIDLNTDQLIGSIDNMMGVHGIAVADGLDKGFITDGKANAVVVFSTTTLKTIATIPVSGKKPDGIIYDPFSKTIFAFNGGSNNASAIDPATMKEIGVVALGGGPEFAVSDGKGKIFNNLEDKNSLNVIDPRSLKVMTTYPLAPCGGPTGIAMDSVNRRLFTVCRENKGMSVVDASNGKVVATIPIGAGVDAVVYDPVTQLIICSNGDATATVIKQVSADSYTVVQTLATQFRAKTMALDKSTHKIYFSVADQDKETRKIVSGTFKVLVYSMR